MNVNDDLLKKIESLEKRVKELESKLKDNLSMFGRSYAQVGNSNSDFLIKTRGLVKILFGSKLLDLIKNGKINADTNFIFTGDSIGNKEGIWIINGEEVWVNSKSSNPINIKSNENAYVSYSKLENITAELLLQALINIGFFYPTKLDVDLKKDGLVYVIEDKLLYIVSENNITPFIKIDLNNIKENLIV